MHVIDRWSTYSSDLPRILAVQEGGLAISGAILGGMAAVVAAARMYRAPIPNSG